MKRSVLGMLGCMIAAVAFAQDPVYSVNVVGFNKHTLEKGKLYLIATAFEDIDGKALKAADVIGTQLPINTTINYYTGGTPPYKTDARSFSGWSTNITFHGNMGFWVKVPNSGTQLVFDVVFKGQVPMDASISNVVASGLNMISYPFTADVPFRNTDLFAKSAINDVLNVWNPATTNYLPPYAKSFSGWGSGTNLILRQGMGFWYKRAPGTPVLVSESRPYPQN